MVSSFFNESNFTLPDPQKNFWEKTQHIRLHYSENSYQRFYVFFVDGIGYHLLQVLRREYPDEFSWLNEGILEPITCLYPSTTSVHVPAFLAGIRPEISGVLEWWYYEPLIDSLLTPLKSRRKDGKFFDPALIEDFFGPCTRWPKGPKKFLWQESSYSHSPVTRYLASDFELNGYENLEHLGAVLNLTRNADEAQFHAIYLPQGDTMSHRMGPDHPRTIMTWREIFSWIREQMLLDRDADYAFISDHGQSRVDPDKTIYLNHFLPEMRNFFCRDGRGNILTPAGSCRNLFLYLEPSSVDLWFDIIVSFLGSRAQVFRKKDLIENGFFLSCVSKRFYETCPSLIVLPKLGESIWWDDGRSVNVKSNHGGITEEEMRVPFWIKINSTISFEG